MKSTRVTGILFACALLWGCVGATPMRQRTVGQQGPTNNVDLSFLTKGKTTRAEVIEKLRAVGTGVESRSLFVARWRTSNWGGWAFMPASGGSGSGVAG